MPIYEYISSISNPCSICKTIFEVRQSINDAALDRCPQCGKPVDRIFSRSHVAIFDTLPENNRYHTYTPEDADSLGLEGGFASDEIWE